jgi:uncharacterized protein YbjT (DUF2867 family)
MPTAILLGASGLVGGRVLSHLRDNPRYDRIRLLTRRPLGLAGGSVEESIVDFDAPPPLSGEDLFCCLGTTIKKAGSNEAFRRVDHDYPLAFARAALAGGMRRMLIVTAVGASAKSGIFYNRVKGELEDALATLAFPNGVHIFRPSMLLGERGESRPGEAVGKAVMGALGFAFAGALKKYRAIDGDAVAKAMVHVAAKATEPGVHVYEGATLFAAAG